MTCESQSFLAKFDTEYDIYKVIPQHIGQRTPDNTYQAYKAVRSFSSRIVRAVCKKNKMYQRIFQGNQDKSPRNGFIYMNNALSHESDHSLHFIKRRGAIIKGS